MRASLAPVLFVFTLQCGAACVRAQSEATAEHVEASKAAFEKGVAAMREKDFDAAVIAFKSSLALREHPAARCNLALALESSVDGLEAGQRRRRERLEASRESYLICASTDASGRYSGHAQARAAELERELAADRERELEIRGGQPSPPPPSSDVSQPTPLERSIDVDRDDDSGGTSPWLTISLVGFGVAAAAFGGGVAFALDAQARKEEIDARVGGGPVPRTMDGMPNSVLGDIDDYNQSRDFAMAFYASAFLLATVSTSFLIIELVSDEQPTTVSLGPGGLQLQGSF